MKTITKDKPKKEKKEKKAEKAGDGDKKEKLPQDKAERKALKAAKKAAKEAKAASAPAARTSPRLAAAAAATAEVPLLPLDDTEIVSVASEVLSPEDYRKKHQIASTSSSLPDPFQTFDDGPFDDRLKAVCKGAGFAAPSPIQAQAWPCALSGADIVAIARTGSGKTLGFLAPAFSRILAAGPVGQG